MSSDISATETGIYAQEPGIRRRKGIYVFVAACYNIPIYTVMGNLLNSVAHDMGVPQRKHELLKAI
jgi:hypothetical protein